MTDFTDIERRLIARADELHASATGFGFPSHTEEHLYREAAAALAELRAVVAKEPSK